jgi:hypothetical protein
VKYWVNWQLWQSEIFSPLTTLTVWNIESTDSFDRVNNWVNWQLWQSEILSELTTLPGVKYWINWQLWQSEILCELTTLTEWNIEWIDNIAGCEIFSQLTALTDWNIEWTENFDRVKYWVHRQLIFMCCSISAWCHDEQERCYRNKLLISSKLDQGFYVCQMILPFKYLTCVRAKSAFIWYQIIKNGFKCCFFLNFR